MSRCCSFFNNPKCGQTLQHSLPGRTGNCERADEKHCGCSGNDIHTGVLTPASADCNTDNTAARPLPRCSTPLLAMMPAIYDECGINLCRVVPLQTALPDNTACVEAQVLDVDFQSNHCTTFTTLPDRSDCIRVTLSDILVTVRLTALDCCGNTLCQSIETVTYLNPDSCCDYSDPDTNPTSITLDLYVPYGLTYTSPCPGTFCPTIQFLGPVAGMNNHLQQGLSVQAAAKVLRFDTNQNRIALGLTLYLRSIYFTEYRIPNEGLAMPPKASLVENPQEDACQDFVDGALLSPQICPASAAVNTCCPEPRC